MSADAAKALQRLPVADHPARACLQCPRCGEGKLFAGFLSLRPSCSDCGLDYAFIDAGDGPAVFIILIAGFIVVFCALIVEVMYRPPFWLHAVLWVPLVLLTDARAAAADEGAADRPAVSSQGAGGPPDRSRQAMSDVLVPPRPAGPDRHDGRHRRGAAVARRLAAAAPGRQACADRQRSTSGSRPRRSPLPPPARLERAHACEGRIPPRAR